MQRILLIKTSSLGDVVHNLPVVADICAHDSEAAIDWVVEAAFADIPRLHPRVRRVIPVALRRWRGALWRTATWREMGGFKRQLQAETYDLILDTQGLFKSAVLARLAHGQRCGQTRASAREPFASYLYDCRIHVARARHAVVRNRDLAAQALGYALPQTPPDYGIHAPREALPEGLDKPYVVCLHGTSRVSKHWPKVYWMSLARELAHRGLIPALPWADAAERERALAIVESAPGAIVLPRLPLRRLAVVLYRSQGVVGVDTGLVHLAAAFNRPTVAIYTDTSPLLTGV
jgi:heptosyltransferase-1